MRTPEYFAAVFGIIRDQNGKILFSRRHNTGHLDGYLSLPAGHVEDGEGVTDAMIREFSEEVGIHANNLKMVFSQQSTNPNDEKTYFNFFFELASYDGILQNMETDKCSELVFRSLDDLEGENVVPYVFDALTRWRNGETFSEITWNI